MVELEEVLVNVAEHHSHHLQALNHLVVEVQLQVTLVTLVMQPQAEVVVEKLMLELQGDQEEVQAVDVTPQDVEEQVIHLL